MKKENLLEKLKGKVASIGWKMFLWGNSVTQGEYWEKRVHQEKITDKRFKSNNKEL